MVLKSAESSAHMMVSALLPYLQWQFTKTLGPEAGSHIVRWFKPVACTWAVELYCNPCEELVNNSSSWMLE